jgi:hypothetical protein
MTPPTKVTPPAQQPNTTNVPPLASTGDTVITEASGSNAASTALAEDPSQRVALFALFAGVAGIFWWRTRRQNKSASNNGA